MCRHMDVEHSVSRPLGLGRGRAVEDASEQSGDSGRQKGDEGCSANDALASSTSRTLHLRVELAIESQSATVLHPVKQLDIPACCDRFSNLIPSQRHLESMLCQSFAHSCDSSSRTGPR